MLFKFKGQATPSKVPKCPFQWGRSGLHKTGS